MRLPKQALIYRTLVTALLWLPVACTATYRVGSAVVTECDGQPCFAIINTPVMRNLNAVVVYDESTAPPSPTWVVGIDPTRERKALTNCVSYGQTFSSQEVDQPAMALRIGQIYKVDLNAEPPDPTDPTHGYTARFCLVAQSGSTNPSVRQIIWNKRTGRWDDEVCGLHRHEKP